jgi:hypothetical protein
MISGGVVTNGHIYIFEGVGFTVKYRFERTIGSLNFSRLAPPEGIDLVRHRTSQVPPECSVGYL